MLRHSLCLAAMLAAAFCQANGQSAPPLSAEEMRQELFGVHMFGVETSTQMRWDECIEPNGRTVYRFAFPGEEVPYSQNGQLRVTDDGLACFSYPSEGEEPDWSCFRALRRGEGYAFFDAKGGPGVFLTTRIDRGKETCPNPGDFIG